MPFDATKRYLYVDENLNTYEVEGSTLIFRGAWQVSVFYNYHDVAEVGVDLYIARHANQGSAPSAIVDSLWSTLVEVPEEGGGGVGPTGYTGYTGPAGVVGPDSVQCSEIDWGYGDDQVNAPQMPYLNENYPLLGTVGDALDQLLYTPLAITSLINSVGVVEIGLTVTSVQLDWTYGGSKPVTNQSFNQGVGSLSADLRTYTHTTSFTSDRTYTLTASDDTNAATRNTLITFLRKRYWGTSANTSLTDAQIIALASYEFDINVGMNSKEVTCAGQYLYFAYPKAWGAATFTVNGLVNTAWTLVDRSFTNASGHAENYFIYRSDNLLTGTYQVVIT